MLDNGRMRTVLFALLAWGLATTCATDAMAQRGRGQSRATASQQGWSSNYQESLATARRIDKPLMIVFRCIP